MKISELNRRKFSTPVFLTADAIPAMITSFVGILIAVINLRFPGTDFNSRLAESFLAGRLDFINLPGSGVLDMALFHGRYYSPFGVLPALIALPFVWLGGFHQGALNLLAVIAVYLLAFRIAQDAGYSSRDSLWLALALAAGSEFLEVTVINAHLPHTLGVLFILVAIWEFQDQRRPWLIGVLIGCATACRPVMGINILFFAAAMPQFRRLAGMGATFGVFVLAIAWYNFARFGSPFEAGYSYQIYSATLAHADWSTPGNLAGPLFALWHIPINAKTFFFGWPDVNHVGTSVLLMSPWLVYLFGGRKLERIDWIAVAVCLLIMLTFLSFRSTGFRQAGYRFSLEFMPLLWWVVVRRLDSAPAGFKAMIGVAVAVNIALIVYFIGTS